MLGFAKELIAAVKRGAAEAYVELQQEKEAKMRAQLQEQQFEADKLTALLCGISEGE